MSYPPYPVNPVTDGLHLVSYTTVKGGTWDWLVGRNVGTDEGFSQQIFTAGGEYRGQVDRRFNRAGVRDGDLVVKVNLGPRLYEFTGTLAVQDGHFRRYTVRIQLAAQNPYGFAVACKQEIDPVEALRSAIDGALLRWASQLQHDDVTPEAMRYRVTVAAEMAKGQTGLAVQEVLYAAAAPSDHYVTLINIKHTHVIDTAQHGIQVVKDEWGREGAAANHAAELTEKGKDDEAARQKAVADADAQLIIAARHKIVARMLDQYDTLLESMTPTEIEEQYPALARTVVGLVAAPGGGLLSLAAGAPGGMAPNGSSNSPNSSPSKKPTEVYDSRLGISFIQVSLDTAQSDVVDTSGRDLLMFFQITRLDEHGPAERARLAVGDIIAQVEGQRLHDAKSISTLALGSQVGGYATVWFLRGAQPYEAHVVIINRS